MFCALLSKDTVQICERALDQGYKEFPGPLRLKDGSNSNFEGSEDENVLDMFPEIVLTFTLAHGFSNLAASQFV